MNDNETGCFYCTAEDVGTFRKGWSIFTATYDRLVDISYCPMCGRKLTEDTK